MVIMPRLAARLPDPLTFGTAAAVLYLLVFLVLPLAHVMGEAALAILAGQLPLDLAEDGFGGYILRITGNSIIVAFTTAVISVALGVPMAFFVTKVHVPLRRMFTILLALPLITPPFISGFATILLFGKTGVVTQILGGVGIPEIGVFGPAGIILTHVLHFVPLAYLTIAAGMKVVPRYLEECAASLGSHTAQVVLRIVLPYVRPHMLMAGVLVFLASFGDVGAPLLVAGNFRVLSLETYTSFTGIGGNPELPIVLAAWSVVISGAALFLVKALTTRTEVKHAFATETLEYDTGGLRLAGLVFCAAATLFLFLPYVVILISSLGTAWGAGLLPNAFTTRHYEFVLQNPEPFVNSLVLSAAATPICVALALLVNRLLRERPRSAAVLDYITLLPFVIPGVVIGIGLLKTYSGMALLGLAVPLAGTPAMMAVAFSVRRLPLAMRVVSAGYSRIDVSLEECSASLGASRWRTFLRITLPQLGPAIAAAAMIAFIRIITELSATLVLYPPGWRTAPVAVFYYVVEGFLGRASAIGVVLVALVALGAALASVDYLGVWRAVRSRERRHPVPPRRPTLQPSNP